VVDNKIDWAQWIDLLGITSESDHGVSHGGEINDGWDTGEILKNDSGWFEWDFDLLF
jgi:hypothetical protein